MKKPPRETDSKPLAPGQPGQVVVGLTKLGMALKAKSWREGEKRDLTPTQGQLLTHLAFHGDGGLSLGSLAAALSVTAPSASEAVAALVKRKLVEKTRDESDARAVRITLTARGRKEAQRASSWPDFLASAFETLSDDERGIMLRGLTKMIRTLQERGEISPARMCVSCVHFRPNAHAAEQPAKPHHCDFVDAPFGESSLRLDCPEHSPASSDSARESWTRFVHVSFTPSHKEIA